MSAKTRRNKIVPRETTPLIDPNDLQFHTRRLEKIARDTLEEIGENPHRPGLRDTPRRWAKMLREITNGHEFKLTTFPNEGYSEMVVQQDITFFSLCEHHMVPFFGTAVVGYIPGKRIVGLSKLSRTVEHFARRLQVQERLTQEIANYLELQLQPRGIGVILKARHLCQEMRGVKKIGAHTVTSVLKGAMLKDPAARREFLVFRGLA